MHLVRSCQEHDHAERQLQEEEPTHHGVNPPSLAQRQEVEVVEMRSNVGNAWGEKDTQLTQGAFCTMQTQGSAHPHLGVQTKASDPPPSPVWSGVDLMLTEAFNPGQHTPRGFTTPQEGDEPSLGGEREDPR